MMSLDPARPDEVRPDAQPSATILNAALSPRCNFSLSSGGAPSLQAVVSIALPAAQAFSASSTIREAREHTLEHDDQPLEVLHTLITVGSSRAPGLQGPHLLQV